MPTPWTLLRYVPVIGAARMPSRFAVVVLLGFCVILAAALAALTSRFPAQRRRLLLAAVGVGPPSSCWACRARCTPPPFPSVYKTIAADPRDVRVLDLPFGIATACRRSATSARRRSSIRRYTSKRLRRRIPLASVRQEEPLRRPARPERADHAQREAARCPSPTPSAPRSAEGFVEQAPPRLRRHRPRRGHVQPARLRHRCLRPAAGSRARRAYELYVPLSSSR